MTPEQQRIAIAEACGIVVIKDAPKAGGKPKDGLHIYQLPDYPNDLNAMHEAEKVLSDEQQLKYWHVLESVIWNPVLCEHPNAIITVENNRLILLFSTAAQRAEAFLRTIGKWTSS